mmetsp:Transcript_4939/g.10819  ORF Transcript_4939/g.10819 Transcript_4939/m.10819 type:complete len:391 (-) Transcript_4939:3116-4288(-)
MVRTELLAVASGGHRLAEGRYACGGVPGVDSCRCVGPKVEGAVTAGAADRGRQDLAKDLGVRDAARRVHLRRHESSIRDSSLRNRGILGEAPALGWLAEGGSIAAPLTDQRPSHHRELRGSMALGLHQLDAHHPLLRPDVPLQEGCAATGAVHHLGVAVQALTPPVSGCVTVKESRDASVVHVGVRASYLHTAQCVNVTSVLHGWVRTRLLQRHHTNHVARQGRQRVLTRHDLRGAAPGIVDHFLGARKVFVHLNLSNPPPIIQAVLVLQSEILRPNHLIVEVGLETARRTVARIPILSTAGAHWRAPDDFGTVGLRGVGVAILGLPAPAILAGTFIQVLSPHKIGVHPGDRHGEIPNTLRHGNAAALLLYVDELGRVTHRVVAGNAEHA